MIVAHPNETFPGERRVAVTPASAALLTHASLEVHLQAGAGDNAGFPDALYHDKQVRLVPGRRELFDAADVLLQVRTPGANPQAGADDLALMKDRQVIIGLADPLGTPAAAQQIADRGVTLFALELIPRTTRAQAMDVLSSMATVAGYKAVILAADRLPKMFPLMMTAAGTLHPARVLVIGAGVAGLQAIATARRLGAVVEAYDVRPAVREQVESLGATFVDLGLDTDQAQDQGGYAKALGDDFYRRQQEALTEVLRGCDVVITTAAVPGKKPPVLITTEMISAMPLGSVIVDLAAPQGGNCQPTQPGSDVIVHGVTILGPTNPPAKVPYHASQMFAKNMATFVLHLIKGGQLNLDLDDPIVRQTLVTHDGQVVHPRIRELLGLPTEPTKEVPTDG